MIVLGRAVRQLDHRRGLLEHLATAVEHEMVVRRDFGKGDGEGGAEFVDGQTAVLGPPKASFDFVWLPNILLFERVVLNGQKKRRSGDTSWTSRGSKSLL